MANDYISGDNPFYILGFRSAVPESELRARWRSLAAIHHPDRGGDIEEFCRLRNAYNAAIANLQRSGT